MVAEGQLNQCEGVNCHVAGPNGSDEDYGVCLDNRQVCRTDKFRPASWARAFFVGA